jgi:copper(I)-binding protein
MRIRALLFAGALILAALPAAARDYRAGGLTITDPWTRPAAAGQNGAGYVSITNRGKAADILLGGQAAGVRDISLHQSRMDGDVATMRPAPEGVVIAPGQTVTLAPGGYHLMLAGLKSQQNPGGRLPVTLRFARAGAVKVVFSVLSSPPSATNHAKPPG